MRTYVTHEKHVDIVIEMGWAHNSEESGKERESGKRQEKKKGKKKRGERGFGELWVFLVFCLTVCFHSIPFAPLFQSTMPPHSITTLSLTPPQSTPHNGTHNAPRNHACVLWCLLFACRCLPALSSLNPNHATPSNHPIHHTWHHQCMSQ